VLPVWRLICCRVTSPSAVAIAILIAILLASFSSIAAAQTTPAPQGQAKKPPTGPPAPQSTHFPILLLAFGASADASSVAVTPTPATPSATAASPATVPAWSIRIGQKGPERLDRPGYPPAVLEPIDVTREGTADTWTYRAKDSATAAAVSVRLTREPCVADTSGAKYTFRAEAQHGQLGSLTGCARIAADLFPKISNQTADEDADADEKKTPTVLPADVISFVSPTDYAYIAPSGKVVAALGKIKKIATAEGTELAFSHDGKKLIYTRSDSKTGPERSLVLYDAASGRSQDLLRGNARQAFWSPDDSRVAYLNYQDQKWQLHSFPAGSPDQAAPVYGISLNSLHGWTDSHTVLASDMQNAYWIQDDGRVLQTVPLKDIYGETFDIAGSDTLRVNPINTDLLVVSAPYAKAPPGAAVDSMGLAAGFFLYEVKSHRRTVLGPVDQWARHAEWSRDGVQILYTRRLSATSSVTYRMLWDGSNGKRYVEGSDLVVGR
jgi:uncharacterized membrane protein